MSFGTKEPSKDLSFVKVLGLPDSQAPALRGLQGPYLRLCLPHTEGPSLVQNTQIHKNTSACLVYHSSFNFLFDVILTVHRR